MSGRDTVGTLRAVLAALAVLALAGCSSVAPWPAPDQGGIATELAACDDWFAALDAQVELAGVRDAGAARVKGFPYLRVDRFTAALRDAIMPNAADTTGNAGQTALVQRLLQLDLQARSLEITNLPAPARARLDSGSGSGTGSGTDAADVAVMLAHTQRCAHRLAGADLATPARMAALLDRLSVPDAYVTGYRIAGLYALSQLPFGIGVRRFEASQYAAFAHDAAPPAGAIRMRLSPPARPPPDSVSAARLRDMLASAPDDPLRVPAPSPAQLELLFAQFAPSFEIDVASDDDRPGALVWRAGAAGDASATLEVDSTDPVVYRQTAYTRYGAYNLLQLVYTLWFPARTAAPGGALDLLAGKLDGLVFRVTLAPDGTPLVYDSMHPCGCFHMFFPTAAARAKPAPVAGIEWAFSPQSLPAIRAQDHLVLRVAAGTHYLQRISVEPIDGATHYGWRDYDELRSLPAGPAARRSVFGPDGFIAGTDRAEAWLFWPMGIARAGAMRQWGRHATAFVGRRHFDDADLMQQRFEFDPAHWRRLAAAAAVAPLPGSSGICNGRSAAHRQRARRPAPALRHDPRRAFRRRATRAGP